MVRAQNSCERFRCLREDPAETVKLVEKGAG